MNKDSQSEKDFLKEVAPTLFGNKLKVDDAAPAGYFESLPATILECARREAQSPVEKPKGILRYINFWNVAIAAGVAVIVALVPAIRHWQSNHGINQPDTATYTYIDAELDEVYADMLVGYIEGDEWILEAEMVDLFAVASYSESMSHDELEDYLIEEGIGEGLILEEMFK